MTPTRLTISSASKALKSHNPEPPHAGRQDSLTSGGWKSYTEQYLDSTGMFRDAVIAILATIAKQERVRLSERVVADLRRPKRQGKVLGRKRLILDREKIRAMHASGQSVRAIGAEVGVSKSLVANIVGCASTSPS